MTSNVGLYLFPQVEILDFAGPLEVFTTASRVHQRMLPDEPLPFHVFTIGENREGIRTRGNLTVQTEYSIENHPQVDLLVIPGGIVSAELRKVHLLDWIRMVSATAKITASVCTGAFLLAQAGLLHTKSATTHWEDLNDFEEAFPDVQVIRDQRWVDEGRVITSAGISAGIDMSLHLVGRMQSEALALKTARQMAYHWDKNPLSGQH